jgi:Ca2+-binding EF-hand superfamily protein
MIDGHYLTPYFLETYCCKMVLCGQQTVFSWILLVQRIAQFYYKNPALRPLLRINPDLENINLSLRGKYDLSLEDKRKIKDVFDLIDIDGCGSIDIDELDAAMYALGYQGFSHKKQESVKQEKPMDLAQFSCMMTGEMASREPFEDILTAFQVLSQDQGLEALAAIQAQSIDGLRKITVEGLKHASREFHLMFNEEELLDMIQDVDIDGSNSVGIHQFTEIMANAPWF